MSLRANPLFERSYGVAIAVQKNGKTED